jgi:ubiquitin-conjugating enzyme E2 R
MAERILMNEFKALSKEKWAHIEVRRPLPSSEETVGVTDQEQLHKDDIFHWNVALIVLNPDSMYYGGYFKAVMEFPNNYPYSPPSECCKPPNLEIYQANVSVA